MFRLCRVTSLDLVRLRIGAEGAARLAAVLPQCPAHSSKGISVERKLASFCS